jgi:hypothetical protein
MARAIEPCDPESDLQQVVFYDQGIGSETFGWLEKKVRGMTGWGIGKNITDCYRFLAHNYEPGDEIYFIGFSRGAYTVRSLGGLLDTVGLLAKTDLEHLPDAYDFYRSSKNKRTGRHFATIRRLKTRTEKPEIAFVGVFDTVGALGIPTPGLSRLLQRRISFHNTRLSNHVKHAYQALAIDEQRAPFQPAFWTAKDAHSHVQQVWFAGVHSNIGGGYPDCALSDISFGWMVQRAMECGLVFNERFISDLKEFNPDPVGRLDNSFSLGYKLLNKIRVMKPYERPIGQHLGIGEMIHDSLLTRLQEVPGYRPANLIESGADIQALLGEKGGHAILNVCGVQMQVSLKRQQVRKPKRVDATVTLEGEAERICELIDLSEQGGGNSSSRPRRWPGCPEY